MAREERQQVLLSASKLHRTENQKISNDDVDKQKRQRMKYLMKSPIFDKGHLGF